LSLRGSTNSSTSEIDSLLLFVVASRTAAELQEKIGA